MIDTFAIQYIVVQPEDRMPKPVETVTPMQWISVLLSLIISCMTAYLAYTCHSRKDSPFHHTLIVLFAFFFSLAYLIYYFLRFIVFGEKCPTHKH